jgi:hypothetical protein
MSKPRSPAIASTVVMLLLLGALSTACARDSHETTGTSQVSSQPPPTAEPLDTTQCGTATATTPAELSNIRSGRHDSFDRIVLEFSGPEPMCSASYVNQIVADGSGEPISLDGNAFLQVALSGAAAHDGAGKSTYDGPDMIDTPELQNVAAVTLAGDFEGQVTIGLGLNVKTHYKVFALSGPTRVVIDVGH